MNSEGPGCSSIGAGAFCEHGPFRPSGDILVRNYYSWNKGIPIKLYLQLFECGMCVCVHNIIIKVKKGGLFSKFHFATGANILLK